MSNTMKRGRKPKHDWDFWEARYVTGDETMEELSALPGAPSFRMMRREAMLRNWAEKRSTFRSTAQKKGVRDAQTIIDAWAKKQPKKPIPDKQEAFMELLAESRAAVSAKHIAAARYLQKIGSERLATLTPDEISAADATRMVETGIKLERLVRDETTENIGISSRDLEQYVQLVLSEVGLRYGDEAMKEVAQAVFRHAMPQETRSVN